MKKVGWGLRNFWLNCWLLFSLCLWRMKGTLIYRECGCFWRWWAVLHDWGMSCPSWRHLLLGECVTFFEVRNLLSVKSPLSFLNYCRWVDLLLSWKDKCVVIFFFCFWSGDAVESSDAFGLEMLSTFVILWWVTVFCLLVMSALSSVFWWWNLQKSISFLSLSLFFFTYQRDLGHRWDRWRWRMSWSLPGNGWWKTPRGGVNRCNC